MKIKKLLAALMAITLIGGAVNAPSQSLRSHTLTASAADYTKGTYEELSYGKYSDHIAIFGCDSKTEGKLNIPAEIEGLPVTVIGSHAFLGCQKITSVTIPDSVTAIGAGAFSDCSGLTSLIIPGSVTTIEERAFENCISLETIKIPASVTSIGSRVFLGCTSLRSITLPDSITKIESYAFADCASLKSITIPKSVERIEDRAFAFCTNLESITILDPDCYIEDTEKNGTTICTGFISDDSYDVYFGGVIRGYVNSGAQAYAEKYSYSFEPITDAPGYIEGTYGDLTYVKYDSHVRIIGCKKSVKGELVIPDEIDSTPVTEIGYSAFYGCGAESVVIPDSVTFIDASAFESCKSLKTVELPDSITSIGASAFYDCQSLEAITVPKGVTGIEDFTFGNCQSLSSISFKGSVTSIGTQAFSNCSALPSINLPKSVKAIGEGAFWSCSGLKEITIPSGVTEIMYETFYGCNKLEAITIPKSVTKIGASVFFGTKWLADRRAEDPLVIVNDILVDGRTCDGDVTIPDGVRSISAKAFGSCTKLNSVYLPGSVTDIGAWAFASCPDLEMVNIPDGVTSIEEYTFSSCDKLKTITIPESVTSIGNCAFASCNSLETIVLPESVTSIGEAAFGRCEGLTSIAILAPDCDIFNDPNTICNAFNGKYSGMIIGYEGSAAQAYAEKYGYSFMAVKTHTDDTYESLTYSKYDDHVEIIGCNKSAESVVIPAEIEGLPVTRIDHFAFGDCTELTSLTIPDSVTSIGNAAFSYCSRLKEITIPDSVTELGEIAFNQCSSLTSVKLPDDLASIEVGLFQYCESLREINIPDSVTSIGSFAFMGCKNLVKITLPDGVTSIGARAFRDCGNLVAVNIPDSVTNIGERAFIFCSALPSVEIPQGVTHIEESTFAWCSALREVKLPDTMTSIGEDAFRECTSLKTISLPESLTVIDAYTFVGCTALEEVIIPEKITGIGKCAFLGCTGLKEITIPENISDIDDSAFRDCASLEAITILNPDCDIFGSAATISWIYEVDKDGNVTDEGFGGTIYGYDGSTAQAYAEEFGYKFEAIEKVPEYTEGELGIIRYRKYSDHIEITNGGLEIPEEIEGLPVTVIAGGAFSRHLELTEITIPKTVTKIGSNAFGFCRDLKKVTILNPNCEIYDHSNTFFNVINDEMYGFFNGTIYGYEGSTAQAYAEKYGRKFESLGEAPEDKGEYKAGDANLDGKVDISDAVLVMQCISNPNKYGVNGTAKGHITEQGYKNADCSGDDGVTNGDALAIQMYLIGLIGKLPE